MRVGSYERVGERETVAVFNHTREVLKIHLVADAGAGRDHGELPKRTLPPAKEEVALTVALELKLDVARVRARRREGIDLHRMVDHELGGDQRIDLAWIAPEVGHRVAHRCQIDDGGNTGEVL